MDVDHERRAPRARWALIAAALLALASPAISQNPASDQLYKRQTADAARRTIEKVIIPRLRAAITPAQQQILDSIDTEVTSNRSEIFLAHAFEDERGTRKIEFGDSFIMLNYVLCQDFLVALKLNEIDAFGRFLQDILIVSEKNGEHYAHGEPIVDTPPFLNYLHEDRATINKAAEETSGPAVSLMIDDLTFILAHELAHHLHGDVRRQMDTTLPRAQQLALIRKQETAADQFAVAAGVKSNTLIMSAAPIFLIFMASEPEPGTGALGDHPPAACRLRDLASVGIPQIEQQDDFSRLLAAPDAAERWKQSKYALLQLNNLLVGICND